MPPVVRLVCSLRYVLLTLTVLLSLGLNPQKVTAGRQPPPTDAHGSSMQKVGMVKKRLAAEAILVLNHYVAPPSLAWLPVPAVACWLPGSRWALAMALAVPRLLAGVRSADVFRARLLAMTLSPQAP